MSGSSLVCVAPSHRGEAAAACCTLLTRVLRLPYHSIFLTYHTHSSLVYSFILPRSSYFLSRPADEAAPFGRAAEVVCSPQTASFFAPPSTTWLPFPPLASRRVNHRAHQKVRIPSFRKPTSTLCSCRPCPASQLPRSSFLVFDCNLLLYPLRTCRLPSGCRPGGPSRRQNPFGHHTPALPHYPMMAHSSTTEPTKPLKKSIILPTRQAARRRSRSPRRSCQRRARSATS